MNQNYLIGGASQLKFTYHVDSISDESEQNPTKTTGSFFKTKGKRINLMPSNDTRFIKLQFIRNRLIFFD